MWRFFSILILGVLLTFSGGSAREQSDGQRHKLSFDKPSAAYPDVNITWIGVGELTTYCLTNTGTHGRWVKPPEWTGYDGTFPANTFDDGNNAEWPAGTLQTYNFSASLWVGGEVPISVTTAGDTIWEPRVDTGQYFDEWGTVTPLYSSIQVFPQGDPNAGEFVYKQKFREKADFQSLWPFLDESVNRRRPANLQLSVANGDAISDEDTYCEYGSFMSKDSAVWISPTTRDYDTKPLGIRIIQRSYSWTSPVAEDILVLDFVIENRNDFPIRNLYVGYFMDNDIGFASISSPQGSNDDLIGFDPALSLGYTFDSDGFEEDWQTPAGYIGAVWLKGIARNAQGSYLTGFQTWTREGSDESSTDQEGNDLLKYRQLNNQLTTDPDNPYETFDNPQDVRMLLNTGPRLRLNPGETDTVTVAIVMGESLSDLRENTINIQRIFDEGYVLPEAPPSPKLTAFPADRKVYLSWDNFPENIPDPFTGEVDFEGYRLYKSQTGLADDWEMLAEYDIFGTRTANSAITKIAKGNTTARFYFLQFDRDTTRLKQFKGGQTYTINFTTEDNFVVINQTTGILYQYDKRAYTPPPGKPNAFTVVTKLGNNWIPLPFAGQPKTTDPNYNQYPQFSGDSTIVYFDGMFFVLGTGPVDPAGQATQDPKPGDVLEIKTFRGDVLGNETGLNYFYVDDKVTNGLSYFYAVTSFDRGVPELGLPPLEGSRKQNQLKVVPVTPPITASDPQILDISYQGPQSGELIARVAQPAQLTGHQYQVSFFDSLNPPYGNAKYWRLTNMNTGQILLDSMANVFGTRYDPNAVNPITEGFVLQLDAERDVRFNPDLSGWSAEGKDSLSVTVKSSMEPYDFTIQFPDFPNAVDTDVNGVEVAYRVFNEEMGVFHETEFYDVDGDQSFSIGDSVQVLGMYQSAPIFSFIYEKSVANPISAGDEFYVVTNKPFQIENTITFKTRGPAVERETVELNKIRVVPNPYYLRAYWDQNRFNNSVMFTNLPAKCTIRIFTISGILIKEINFDSNSSDPNMRGGTYMWNLRNKEELKISSGLYIFQVDSDRGEYVGKFAIVR